MFKIYNLFMVSLKVKHESQHSDNRFGEFSFIEMFMKNYQHGESSF